MSATTAAVGTLNWDPRILVLLPRDDVLRFARHPDDAGITWSVDREHEAPRVGRPTLIVESQGGRSQIVGVGRFGRHGTAATDLDRAVMLDLVLACNPPIDAMRLARLLPATVRSYFESYIVEGGTLPERTGLAALEAIASIDPAAGLWLSQIANGRTPEPVPPEAGVRWAIERDATELAVRISDLPSDDLYDWHPPQPDQPFLAGLLREGEAAMIDYDASRFPDLRSQRSAHVNIHVFTDGDRRLEVVNVNATGVESALGTDLLYYNHQTRAFVLVQYKKSATGDRLVVDQRLRDQVQRMQAFIQTSKAPRAALDYRLEGETAAWLKIVRTDPITSSGSALLRGIMIPTAYFDLLMNDDRTRSGPTGRVLSRETVDRYFTSTNFVMLVREGWIGTVGISEQALKRYVAQSLRSGHSLVMAEEFSDDSGFARRRTNRTRRRRNTAGDIDE